MIQRIQTVYLLVAEMLIGTLFFVPLAEIAGKEASIYRFDLRGIYPEGILKPEIVYSCLPLVILWAMSLIITMMTVFLFKNRILQMRLSAISIFIQLSLGGLIYYCVWSGSKQLSGTFSFTIYFVFPIVAAILIFLAYRSIKKDELLVRSIDRIR